MSFHWPSVWWLLLLLLVPLAWWGGWGRRRRNSVMFSSIASLRAAGATWAVKLRWIVPMLRALAVILLIVCLGARRQADEHTRSFSEGVAIELVVDRSGSMKAQDFELNGREATRLEAVKTVVNEFVVGGDSLPGRPDDLIGLITFARYADSRCPLTLDQDHLIDTVETTEFAVDREEDGTAIGDAIALGVERLHSLEQRADVRVRDPIKSKVMILLTDGENNAGDVEPLLAAEMASALDIRIYTIGAGTDRGSAPMLVDTPMGKIRQNVPVSIDEETLREIASLTGGEYFRATDTDSLQEIYARIDELERTEIEQQRYTNYKELSVEPVHVGFLSLPPLMAIVFCLLALEMLLASTRFQSLP